MARSAFKISGIFVLLCGLAAALPQAQIRTGVSTKSSQETSAPAQAVKNSQTQQQATLPPSGNHRQKPAPGVTEPPAPVVVPAAQQLQPAPPPLRPEQMPPVPPKVIYQNGLLSVEATNSTLSDILNVIRTKAGIQIDGLQGAQDRVAAKLGPAAADRVLTALLHGSRFDYVILGRVDRPDLVQRVILTPASGSALASASTGIQPLQPRPGMVLVQPVDDDEGAGEEQVAQPQPQVQPMPQQGIQPAPVQQSGNGLQGNGPKTSEQLLEELKQMQQQQQQQQQNQPNQQQNLQPPPPLKPRIPQ
jgi:hypothetical protein